MNSIAFGQPYPSAGHRVRRAFSGFSGGSIGLLLVLASGCATVDRPHADDPFESFNRSVFSFNEAVDKAVLKPVATSYEDYVPSMIRTGVNNFFDNLRDAWSFVNNVLQLKPAGAGDSALRFGVNTVMGLGGLLDVAGEMRIPRHTEDFGQTIGYWGGGPGPYLVLPLLGPSTVRDTAALPVDVLVGNPLHYVDPLALRYSLTSLRIVDIRAGLLRTTALLSDVALDKYSFVRDAHLQFRRAAIGVGEDSGQGKLQQGRGWVNDLTNRSGPAAAGDSDDAQAGQEPDYSQPADDAGKAPDYTQPASDAGRAPDYTRPADDAGKAPDYTQPADNAGKAPDYTKP
ncbi:MAG: VacJ family lipoprotein [Burkholderiales bacterium]